MACLTNYAVQCTDVQSGLTGCFFFDQEHWQKTGEFKAVSTVYSGLAAFYENTLPEERKSLYLERTP